MLIQRLGACGWRLISRSFDQKHRQRPVWKLNFIESPKRDIHEAHINQTGDF